MNILFLFRKKPTDIGGLSRFTIELTQRFPPTNWKKPIDLIHATDATLLPLGVLLKLFFRAPLTVTVHGRDVTWPNPIYQHILAFCMPFVHTWIVVSDATLTLLKQKGVKKIRVITSGISIAHLKHHGALALPAFTGKTILTTVGNLVPRKGHVWFIRHVFTKLPPRFIYCIIGAGTERARVESTIQRLHLAHRVFCLGQLTNQHLAEVFKHTHIYVTPNQHIPGDFEGFGIATGEAAAFGLPVLASRVDGLPSVIHHNKNGLLVTATPNAWIQAILSVESPKVCAAIGRKARQYTLSHFTWKKTITEYSRLFQEAGGKRKSFPKRFFPK